MMAKRLVGRPIKGKEKRRTKKFGVAFTEKMAVWLATEASARGVSQNDIVNEALDIHRHAPTEATITPEAYRASMRSQPVEVERVMLRPIIPSITSSARPPFTPRLKPSKP